MVILPFLKGLMRGRNGQNASTLLGTNSCVVLAGLSLPVVSSVIDSASTLKETSMLSLLLRIWWHVILKTLDAMVVLLSAQLIIYLQKESPQSPVCLIKMEIVNAHLNALTRLRSILSIIANQAH